LQWDIRPVDSIGKGIAGIKVVEVPAVGIVRNFVASHRTGENGWPEISCKEKQHIGSAAIESDGDDRCGLYMAINRITVIWRHSRRIKCDSNRSTHCVVRRELIAGICFVERDSHNTVSRWQTEIIRGVVVQVLHLIIRLDTISIGWAKKEILCLENCDAAIDAISELDVSVFPIRIGWIVAGGNSPLFVVHIKGDGGVLVCAGCERESKL
jgi:hypothetical protein